MSAVTQRPYVGRFAPSPTGALHAGSLLAAVGSYVDARAHRGRWLLRIEDLDVPRVVNGAEATILQALETLGLHWDGDCTRQSESPQRYAAALEALRATGRVFACRCSRRELTDADTESGCVGDCQARTLHDEQCALRFTLRLPEGAPVVDRFQGAQAATDGPQNIVIRRRDQIFCYQLAVVVDDAHDGITDVVRGSDLLSCTPWQIQLQRALTFATPSYAHLPVLVEANGEKLAKSRHSPPIDARNAAELLWQSLCRLGQNPPAELRAAPPDRQLQWAVENWTPSRFFGVRTLRL